MPFTIAIIGRPNVGKSTLFNRLVGKKLALVDDRPGVTRDRREGEGKIADLRFTIIDTAGLEQNDEGVLSERMRRQTEAAIEQADMIFFVIDARVGVTPSDRHFAQLVRRASKPILLLANKAEGKQGDAGFYEAFTLGFGDPIQISAEHGQGLNELYDGIRAAMPEDMLQPEEELDVDETKIFDDEEDRTELEVTKPMRIAVVGRPTAGKSTLLNRILEEDRLLTGPEAGITRDSISVETEWTLADGTHRKVKLFDTAGLRKRGNVVDKLEKQAAADALRAVRFAEVVVVLLDATIPFEKQDLTIVDLVAREGRALVIGLNKWDLVNDQVQLKELRDEADRLLPQVRGMPVVPVSGLTGQGLQKFLEAVVRVHETWNRRISTGKLNRWLGAVIEKTPPPAVSGWRIKIRYMTQAKARPPHFVIFGNQLDELPTSYERFLINGIRETFALKGVPIRITKRMPTNPYEGRKRR